MIGLGDRGRMNGNDVAPFQQILELRLLRSQLGGLFRRDEGVVHENIHAEIAHQPDVVLSGPTGADNAHGDVKELPDVVLSLFPAAGRNILRQPVDVFGSRDGKAQRCLRNAFSQGLRRTGDPDTLFPQLIGNDGFYASRRMNHQL